MQVGSLQAGSRAWCAVEGVTVTARGRITPRLVLSLGLRTCSEKSTCELRAVQVALFWGEELIGQGLVTGEAAGTSFTRSVTVEIPTSHRMLRHVTDTLGPSTTVVDLEVRYSGQLAVSLTEGQPRFHEDPPAGQVALVTINDHASRHRVQVPRAHWHAQVITVSGGEDVVFLEVPVIRGAPGQTWAATNARIADARRKCTMGDYPGVFLELRGALDGLPGAKQHIFDGLPDPARKPLDDLTAAVGKFFHTGRHVAEDGEMRGQFPVNARTARLALDLATVLFAHISTILAAHEQV